MQTIRLLPLVQTRHGILWRHCLILKQRLGSYEHRATEEPVRATVKGTWWKTCALDAVDYFLQAMIENAFRIMIIPQNCKQYPLDGTVCINSTGQSAHSSRAAREALSQQERQASVDGNHLAKWRRRSNCISFDKKAYV